MGLGQAREGEPWPGSMTVGLRTASSAPTDQPDTSDCHTEAILRDSDSVVADRHLLQKHTAFASLMLVRLFFTTKVCTCRSGR